MTGHAPRERVSWNEMKDTEEQEEEVTLHVSVWVEMIFPIAYLKKSLVTLHVSVWVEIAVFTNLDKSTMSRSTWACELKLSLEYNPIENYSSRSTWACELKLPFFNALEIVTSHAPRERVSWNPLFFLCCHQQVVSRSTWACELKCKFMYSFFISCRSRSTWACELKLNSSS